EERHRERTNRQKGSSDRWLLVRGDNSQPPSPPVGATLLSTKPVPPAKYEKPQGIVQRPTQAPTLCGKAFPPPIATDPATGDPTLPMNPSHVPAALAPRHRDGAMLPDHRVHREKRPKTNRERPHTR